MIFITGSTGFLGKHLVKALLNENYKLRCLARETSNTEHLKHPNIEIYYGDITSYPSIKNSLTGVDTVIHLATIYGISNKDLFYKVNVEGAKNIVKACKENKVKRVIFHAFH